MTASYAYRHEPSQAQRHNLGLRLCKPLGMADDNSLPVRRLRLFLAQYEQEHGYGWQTRLAQLTGRHQTHLGRMAKGERGPGLDDVTAIVRELGVNERFFYDEDLGDSPDYHDFVGTRVERDDTKGAPAVESFIEHRAELGMPLPEEAIRSLRSTFYKTAEIDTTLVEHAYSSWVARQKGKAIERPSVGGQIDEARGQRRLPPSKPRH